MTLKTLLEAFIDRLPLEPTSVFTYGETAELTYENREGEYLMIYVMDPDAYRFRFEIEKKDCNGLDPDYVNLYDLDDLIREFMEEK